MKGARATQPDADGDRALVERLLAGDEAAFVALLDTYGGALRRLARVFCSSAAVADEVVQETWAAVLDGLASFQGRSSLKTWIFTILANRARTRAVREGRTIPFSALADPDDKEPAVDPSRFKSNGHWAQSPARWDADTPEKLFLNREAGAELARAIDTLPPAQRAVLLLRDVEEWDSAEVCNVLEITETNQRVLLHRARARVRRALEEYLGRDA